jgi:hypothetical protein
MRLRFWTFLAALLASLAIAAPAYAVGSIFVVRGVDVEATGESGTKACEAAYGQGQDRAWQKLIARIVPEADVARVPQPAPDQLNEFVSGYEVSGEKKSNTKCIATMTYLFKGDLVKKFLRERAVSFADRRGPATLAIPLYETPEGTRLWGDDNLWLNAFRVVKLENELIPVEAPYGDDGDKAAIPPGASLGTDWLSYKTIADKYGMKAVLVARATYANGQVTVEADLVSETGSEHFSASATGADERGALANAVRNLAVVMGESWKQTAAIDNSISAALSVWAPYSSLAQRNDIEARLRKIQNILDVNVTRVTTTGMSVSLRYRGRNDQFEQALRQAGFGIYPGSGGGLVLDSYRAGVPMSFGGGAKPEGEEPPPPPAPVEEPVEEPQVIRPQ